MFKVALLDQWLVVVSGPKMVDELRRRPDEELSFMEGIEDVSRLSVLLISNLLFAAYRLSK